MKVWAGRVFVVSLLLGVSLAGSTATYAQENDSVPEADQEGDQPDDSTLPLPDPQTLGASTAERAAANIRASVRSRALERIEAARSGDSEALAALMVADDQLISTAAQVQLKGSELDTIQFEHRESVEVYEDAKRVLDDQLARLYAVGPLRVGDDFDGSSIIEALGRNVLLDALFAASEKSVLDAYVATEIDIDLEALAADRIAAEEVLRDLRERRYEALLSSEATAAELERLAALPDDVLFPVAGNYNFVDTFLAPRMYGTPDAHRHQGTDVFAERGTPLVAMERGIVVRIGEIRLGGLRLWLIGESGTHYYYAHLSGFADITEGQFVEAGTVLGYVGNTGNAISTPPHLHIQVHPGGGRAVNPYPLLRQLADRDARLASEADS